MIVEMGDYAWSEHIVTVFLACQITTICTWRRVHWSDESRFFVTPYQQSCKVLAPTKHFISGQPYFEHNSDDVMSTVDVLWVVTLTFPDGGGV
jgi:hypothetical protein